MIRKKKQKARTYKIWRPIFIRFNRCDVLLRSSAIWFSRHLPFAYLHHLRPALARGPRFEQRCSRWKTASPLQDIARCPLWGQQQLSENVGNTLGVSPLCSLCQVWNLLKVGVFWPLHLLLPLVPRSPCMEQSPGNAFNMWPGPSQINGWWRSCVEKALNWSPVLPGVILAPDIYLMGWQVTENLWVWLFSSVKLG